MSESSDQPATGSPPPRRPQAPPGAVPDPLLFPVTFHLHKLKVAGDQLADVLYWARAGFTAVAVICEALNDLRPVDYLLGTFFATSDREAKFLRAIKNIKADPVDPLWMSALELRAADSYHPAKAAAVFARLAANGSRQVPTLAMFQQLDLPQNVARDDERLKYLPAAQIQGWHEFLDALLRQAAAKDPTTPAAAISGCGCHGTVTAQPSPEIDQAVSA
jgi:hypothetical protein